MKNEPNITIQDLYPELTPEQQEEAESNLLGYLEVVLNIYERIESEGKLDELTEVLAREKRFENSDSDQ